MWNVLAAVGHAAYKTAAMTGLAAGTEQPPYPCAWPLQKLDSVDDTERVQELLDSIYVAAKDLLKNNDDHKWQIVDFQDPDRAKGGDLHLFTRPHMGPFNFAKATMSLQNCTPEQVMDIMFSDKFAQRQRYSADLVRFDVLAQVPGFDKVSVQVLEYWVPKPGAHRDFVYLVDKKYDEEEDSYYVYGCSIDYTPEEKNPKTVRGSCLWAWELTPIGGNTLATYASVMNPRGWTPTFVIGWLKTEIAKELVSARRLLYGEEVKLERTSFEAIGVSKDEIARANDEFETLSAV